jgi:Golgi nucleoside diphosphatase
LFLQEADKAKVVEVNLGCRDRDSTHRYRLFVTTFLGYGANEAISRYHRHRILGQFSGHQTGKKIRGLVKTNYIGDPCLPIGFKQDLTVHIDLEHLINTDAKNSLKEEQPLFLVGSGNWDSCYKEIAMFIKTSEPYFKHCDPDEPSCPDAGIQMPPIPVQNSEFYGFSEFWYTMEDVVRMGGPYLYDKFAIASRVRVL